VKKINHTGIPLVIADRRMQTHGQNLKWQALVSWDMVKSGTIGGEQTVKAINGKGNIVVVEGTPGAGSTIDRGNAFYSVIAKYPDIKILAKIPADFNRAKGQEVTENILRRFKPGEIDAIYYMADEMLFGGLQAIKAANRLHEFKIVSVDGEKEALDMLRAGDFDYDAEFHPDDQAVAVPILCDFLHGRKPDLANQTYDGRKMDLVEYEGMPWVRPTVYPIDKSNANLPENKGW
jgi:ABC-type sugar transport system substrate-binding protein